MTPQTGQFIIVAIVIAGALIAAAVSLFGPKNWDANNKMDFDKWGPLPTGDQDNVIQTGDEADSPYGEGL